MSIRETFSDSINLEVIDEYDQGDMMQISTVLGHVYHVAFRRVLSKRPFRHLSNHVFGVRNFGNTKLMRVIFFFKTFKISDRFQNWSKKLRKSFLFMR